jgi:hypothetical protein
MALMKDSTQIKPQVLTLKVIVSSPSKYNYHLNFPQFLQDNDRDIISGFWLVKMHSGLFFSPTIRNNMTEARGLYDTF